MMEPKTTKGQFTCKARAFLAASHDQYRPPISLSEKRRRKRRYAEQRSLNWCSNLGRVGHVGSRSQKNGQPSI
jgi:hypothetical protein